MIRERNCSVKVIHTHPYMCVYVCVYVCVCVYVDMYVYIYILYLYRSLSFVSLLPSLLPLFLENTIASVTMKMLPEGERNRSTSFIILSWYNCVRGEERGNNEKSSQREGEKGEDERV